MMYQVVGFEAFAQAHILFLYMASEFSKTSATSADPMVCAGASISASRNSDTI